MCYDELSPNTNIAMWVTVNRTQSTEIDDVVVKRILNLYPEEKLEQRAVFQAAFSTGNIEYKDLVSESEKILIPWQMFFLDSSNFNTQINHIEKQRKDKVSEKLVAKRKGTGEVTSKRIIDRLIRQQNFLVGTGVFTANTFCGSLKNIQTKRAVEKILKSFSIDRNLLWKYRGKGTALEYIINQIEKSNINVSRGVLTNKILPTWQVVPSDVYRSTSGFAIKDDKVPFVFLPSEMNPDEVESRQIYTLIYLLAVIGLDQYDYYLSKDFRAKIMGATGMSARIHSITAEFLMPSEETEKLRGQSITTTLRDSLCEKFKVSPLALVITLRMRGVINKQQFEALKPEPFVPKKRTTQSRTPKVSTSVEKFCGAKSFEAINNGISSKSITNVQAQYLIFGAANKKGYYKYRTELGL